MSKMSYTLPAESKFKIIVSCSHCLNVRMSKPIPTTDGRLLRRMGGIPKRATAG